jgi:hypothetical protein
MGGWSNGGWFYKLMNVLDADESLYLGDPTTEGSWRIVRDGDNLSFERYESGNWISKGANLP